jgi:hypothetical protein
MFKINLPEIDTSKHIKRYIGANYRYATATAISFIDNNTIIAASLLGKSIYLIKILESNYEILDQIQTNTFPDLMDYKNSSIVTANTDSNTISFYKITNDKLSLVNDVSLHHTIHPHGCRFLDHNNVIITNKYKKNLGCFQYNISSNKIKKVISDSFVSKDVFIKDNLSIAVSTEFVALAKPSKPPKSNICLYSNYNLLDSIQIKGQTESVTLLEDNIFITDQYNNTIIYCKLFNNKIKFFKNINGFNFPHGISSFNNKIAVSNYGDNSIQVYDIDELI